VPEPWDENPEDESSSRRALRLVNPVLQPGRSMPSARLRPREKVLAGGAVRLGAAELLSVVLGAGTREEPAWRVADRLVRRHGLDGLAKLAPGDLARSVASASRPPRASPRPWSLAARAPTGPVAAPPGAPERRLPASRRSRPREEGAPRRPLPRRPERAPPPRDDLGRLAQHDPHPSPRDPLPRDRPPRPGVHPGPQPPSGCLEPSEEDLEFTRAVHRAGRSWHRTLRPSRRRGGEYTSLRERGVF